MNELAPMVKNMEKLAADFSADPEQDASRSGGYGICKVVFGRRKQNHW